MKNVQENATDIHPYKTNYFLAALLVKLCTAIDKQSKNIYNNLSTFQNSNFQLQGATYSLRYISINKSCRPCMNIETPSHMFHL